MSSTKAPEISGGPSTQTANGRYQPPLPDPADVPNPEDYVTEDGKPVENFYVERLYKMLIEALYASWRPPGPQPRPFVACSNVGWFHARSEPAVVPDMMLSLDVAPLDPKTPAGRSYFQWEYKKAPDLAIEVISDSRADEGGEKMRLYERLNLPYYVIHDPQDIIGQGIIRAFELRGGKYADIDHRWIPNLGLGLVMQQGTYLDSTDNWLRWCDEQGRILLTGQERADQLRAQLRALGIEPNA